MSLNKLFVFVRIDALVGEILLVVGTHFESDYFPFFFVFGMIFDPCLVDFFIVFSKFGSDQIFSNLTQPTN